ncbi:hypothetical protein PoB_001654500, partial [Plakobranchus ocellatus]
DRDEQCCLPGHHPPRINTSSAVCLTTIRQGPRRAVLSAWPPSAKDRDGQCCLPGHHPPRTETSSVVCMATIRQGPRRAVLSAWPPSAKDRDEQNNSLLLSGEAS